MLIRSNRKESKRCVVGKGFCKCSDKRFVYGKGFADIAHLVANTAVLGKNIHSIVKDSKELRKDTSKTDNHRLTKLIDEII